MTTQPINPANFSAAVLGVMQDYYRGIANRKTSLIPLEQCRLRRTATSIAVGWACLNWRFVHSA